MVLVEKVEQHLLIKIMRVMIFVLTELSEIKIGEKKS